MDIKEIFIINIKELLFKAMSDIDYIPSRKDFKEDLFFIVETGISGIYKNPMGYVNGDEDTLAKNSLSKYLEIVNSNETEENQEHYLNKDPLPTSKGIVFIESLYKNIFMMLLSNGVFFNHYNFNLDISMETLPNTTWKRNLEINEVCYKITIEELV